MKKLFTFWARVALAFLALQGTGNLAQADITDIIEILTDDDAPSGIVCLEPEYTLSYLTGDYVYFRAHELMYGSFDANYNNHCKARWGDDRNECEARVIKEARDLVMDLQREHRECLKSKRLDELGESDHIEDEIRY